MGDSDLFIINLINCIYLIPPSTVRAASRTQNSCRFRPLHLQGLGNVQTFYAWLAVEQAFGGLGG